MKFRSFQNTNKPRPVLLFADNFDQYEILVTDIEEKVKRWCRDRGDSKLVCVILFCMRRSTMPHKYNEKKCVLLKHELTSREKTWFKRTHDRLDKNHKEDNKAIDPKLLMSFNILKAEFDKDAIKRMVRDVLKEMNSRDEAKIEQYERERRLLKYVALVNCYDLEFNSIPTSVFDPIMNEDLSIYIGIRRGRLAWQARWETSLSSELRILINESMTSNFGYISSIRVSHPLLSKVVLELLFESTGSFVLSKVALDFLHCQEIFSSRSNTAKMLLSVVKNVLIHRSKSPNGLRETQFSPLIQAIVDNEGIDNAVNVLIQGFNIIKDAFIAQQLARLFIAAKNWNKAEEYAKVAVDLNPQNSFLWDTYGRLYQKQAVECSKDWCMTLSPIDADKGPFIIKIVRNAVKMFQKVQKLNDEDTHSITSNDAGYFGEIESVITLLECLKCISILKNGSNLKNLLMNEEFSLPELEQWIDDEGNCLIKVVHNLLLGANSVLNRLEDEKLQLRDETFDEFKKNLVKQRYDLMCRFKENLDMYLGEGLKEVPEQLPEDKKCQYRRRQVVQLGGQTLLRFLDLRRNTDGEKTLLKICDLMQHNLACPKYVKSSDYMALISAKMSLLILSERYLPKIKYAEMAEWSRQLYLHREDMPTSLEPFLFYSMFHWPRRSTAFSIADKELIQVIKLWKEAYYKKYPRQKGDGKPYRKKDTTIFFFANGSDMASIVSYEELRNVSGGASEVNRETFWKFPNTLRTLQRFKGILSDDGLEVDAELEYPSGNKASVSIATSFPIHRRDMWNKTIYFVIGFNWFGPKAFDIELNDPTIDTSYMASDNQATKAKDRVPYRSLDINEDREKMKKIMDRLELINIELTRIQSLKTKMEKEQLTKEEVCMHTKLKKLQKVNRPFTLILELIRALSEIYINVASPRADDEPKSLYSRIRGTHLINSLSLRMRAGLA